MKGPGAEGLQRLGHAMFERVDVAANRAYTSRYNPLYHSGAIVVLSFVVLVLTGLYLLLFYRIGSPYASVERIVDQPWTGRWIRTLHRYVSDLAVAAALVHAFRMLVQDRAWGPRALAWLSGLVLLGIFLLCGWTGYVMVWDEQGQLLAMEGARLLDVLPLFSEPLVRAFVGEVEMPQAFFFMNLFAHIAIPVGVLLVLWVHVSRLARPTLMPPRKLSWGIVGAFVLLAVVWTAPLGAPADALRIPSDVRLDLWYNGWLPLTRGMPAPWVWAGILMTGSLAVAVPWWTRTRKDAAPPASWVNPRHCTGCEQCYLDCPYEAIRMVTRDDGRAGLVGFVDPLRCVSCGICAGSCAPMVVGPPGRTGRDQLREVRVFIEEEGVGGDDIVLIGCDRTAALSGPAETSTTPAFHGCSVIPVGCAGSLHTSVIEFLVRAGAGGVMVVSCPGRDCWNREGVRWLKARIEDEREAELKARVDRNRIRVVHVAAGETKRLREHIDRFREDVRALDPASGEEDIDMDAVCEPPSAPFLQIVD